MWALLTDKTVLVQRMNISQKQIYIPVYVITKKMPERDLKISQKSVKLPQDLK